jgi:hypothetical protein
MVQMFVTVLTETRIDQKRGLPVLEIFICISIGTTELAIFKQIISM